jgi:hypothetical protein
MTIWATGLATRIVLRKSVLRLLVSALRHHHGTFQLDAGVYENLPYILFLKKSIFDKRSDLLSCHRGLEK